MNKLILLFTFVFILGCQETGVEKPDNLIEREEMTSIFYDISLLEAVKTQNIEGGISSQEMNQYIYKKYKIDSLQYIKSKKYYASDIAAYKKMYQKVKERLEAESKVLDEKNNPNTNPADTIISETPTVM